MSRQIALLVALLSLLPAAARAQEKGPPAYKLSAEAAAEPVPALKYQFIPSLLDQTPGNAALFYMKAAMLLGQSEQQHKNLDLMSEWLAKPLSELPREEVRKMLENYKSPLHEVELGVKRERCDWELPLRDGDPFSITLEEIQRARSLGRVLALQARLQIAESKFDEAIATLRTAFTLARHVGDQPTLVSGLVGMAIINGHVIDQVETLMQTSGAPNLYWALTTLPTPTIDLRNAVQFEINGVDLTFPELQRVETTQRTSEEWDILLKSMNRRILNLVEAVADQAALARLSNAAMQEKADPAARKYLLEIGFAADKVQAMPRSQALITASAMHYRVVRDSLYRWFYVPYWQSQAVFETAERALAVEPKEFDLLPFQTLVPALANVSFASARIDRRMAALKTLEAVRIYAAAHEGQLPATLSDVTTVAIPLDPVWGKPFSYQVDGQTATITSAPPAHMAADRGGLHYELKLSKAKR